MEWRRSGPMRCLLLVNILVSLFMIVYPKCITLDEAGQTARLFDKFEGETNDHDRMQYYSYIYYKDNAAGEKTLFLGSSDSVYKVDPDTFSETWYLDIPHVQRRGSILTCEDLTAPNDQPFQCRNHISVIEKIGDRWLVCGSNAKNPACWYCDQTDPSQPWSCTPVNIEDVKHFIPESPNFDSTWLYNNISNVAFAGTERKSHNPGFFKKLDATSDFSTILKNDENRPNWLNVPAYVGDPIEYNGYIYYFFRETATEYMNAGKILYSRVGRVCANNSAASRFPGDFQTMVKARLNCSIDLKFPFYFNEIQDTFVSKRDDGDQIIYAVFTTPGSGPPASAVCAYSLLEIENLFDDLAKYKGQDSYGADWLPESHNVLGSSERFGKCDIPYTSDEQVRAISDYSLVDQLVPNLRNVRRTGLGDLPKVRNSDSPLLYLNNYRFTSIAKVDEDSDGGPVVLMIGTDNKRILKAAFKPDMERSEYGHKIAEIKLSDTINPDVANEVRDMVVHQQGNKTFVIATAISDAFKVNVEFCFIYETCEECRRVNDPHCTWDDTKNKCTSNGVLLQKPEDVKQCKVYIGSSEYDVVKSFALDQPASSQSSHPVNDYSFVVAKKGSKLGVTAPNGTNWVHDVTSGATPEIEFYAVRIGANSKEAQAAPVVNFTVTLDDTEEERSLVAGIKKDDSELAALGQAEKIYKYDCELAVYEYNMTVVRQNMLKECAEAENAVGVFQCPSARFDGDHDSYTCPAS